MESRKGNGTPLQYSCLENPMDGGAWWAVVHGVAKSRHDWATSLSRVGEGNGNPFQCSCLENPRDGGAWWAAVYGVAQSRTRLKRLSSSSSSRHLYPRALGCLWLMRTPPVRPLGAFLKLESYFNGASEYMRMSSRFVLYLIPNYGWKMCLAVETSDTQATFGRERVKARGR